MKEQFIEKTFRADTMKLILLANQIIAEYAQQGYTLTLRQLYYQLVARDFLANTEKNYKKLGVTISDARLAGLIDWNAIEDRTRSLSAFTTWDKPEEIVGDAAKWFIRNLWDDQPFYAEVWVEKEALAGVVARACETRRVPHFSCRGYVSQSEMYTAAKRLKRHAAKDKDVRLIHLGDHDPSGIDMSRDIEDRLELMMGGEFNALEFRRIALNHDQIEQYNPPPNPAKSTDSRFKDYRARFGSNSWELDALEPSVLVALINEAVEDGLDLDAWAKARVRESVYREEIRMVSNDWGNVVDYLEEEES